MTTAWALSVEVRGMLADRDPRVRCIACGHHMPKAHRCAHHRAAGLQGSDIAPALALLLQHCPAWTPRGPTVRTS